MTKINIKTVLIGIAAVLLIALVCGLVAHFIIKDKDSGATDITASTNGVVYDDGDNVVTVTLEAGTHTITKGDVLGLYGLTLEV